MWDRIASVEYAGRAGAGCVVAPGVVLTARHVVDSAAGRESEPRIVQLSHHQGEGPRARAEVAWARGEIAVVRCRPRDLGVEVAPLRWGELACRKPPVPRPECSVLGLPHEAMLRHFGQSSVGKAEFRPPQAVTGRIHTVEDASRIYTVHIDHQPPEHMRGDGALWRGMSGAAVFCGNVLIGMVAHPPSGWSHGRLEAVPARQLLEDRSFCDVVEAACGVRPRLEAADLDGLFDGAPRPVAAASYFLSPHSEVVSFLGLDAELSALSGWCSTQQAADVAVLRGEAGSGKTRLGTELVRRLSERRAEAECDPSGPDVPWAAGFLSKAPAAHPAPYGILRHLTRPALIVIDDAHTRLEQVEELLAALAGHHSPPAPRIRVLLTARSTRGWWKQLTRRHTEVTTGTQMVLDPRAVYRQYTPAQVQELAELDFSKRIMTLHRAGVRDDWDAYEAADRRAALPPRRERQSSDSAPGVLTVHMDALASVLLHSPGESTDGHPATVTLLDHELQYVQRNAGAAGHEELTPELLHTLITVQGMAGAQNKEEADAVIRTAWDFHHRKQPHPLNPDTLLTLRHTASALYPALDGSYFASLQPAALTAALIDHTEEASDGEFLKHVLPHPTFSEHQHQHCLTTIARSITARPHLVQPTASAIASHPQVLAAPAAGITQQLPQPWQTTWLEAIEHASTGHEQQQHSRAAASALAHPPTTTTHPTAAAATTKTPTANTHTANTAATHPTAAAATTKTATANTAATHPTAAAATTKTATANTAATHLAAKTAADTREEKAPPDPPPKKPATTTPTPAARKTPTATTGYNARQHKPPPPPTTTPTPTATTASDDTPQANPPPAPTPPRTPSAMNPASRSRLTENAWTTPLGPGKVVARDEQ